MMTVVWGGMPGTAQGQSVRNAASRQLSEHAAHAQDHFDAMSSQLEALRPALTGSTNSWDTYQWAKAEAWLDFAFDARAQRDVSSAEVEAMAQAQTIAAGLAAHRDSLSLDTPLVAGAHRLREDLWQRAEVIKHLVGVRCAQAQLAQFEVQLVQAGHAEQMLGWRHAKPYLQAVERLAKQAEAAQRACPPVGVPADSIPATEVPANVPVAAVALNPPALPRATRTAPRQIHFAFNSSAFGTASKKVLQEVAAALHGSQSTRIDLRGYTDLRGSDRYNIRLSERRAQRVRRYLVQAGVPYVAMHAQGFGKTHPLSLGGAARDHARNRRVEIAVLDEVDVKIEIAERDMYLARWRQHRAKREK